MKGILFKPEMIKAIIEGKKTQTRRVIKPQPDHPDIDASFATLAWQLSPPRYNKGEVVYVKEVWAIARWNPYEVVDIIFNDLKVKLGVAWDEWCNQNYQKPNWEQWHSPRFMRAKFARYFIEITDVSVEKIKEISWQDCLNEGIIQRGDDFIYKCAYSIPQGAFIECWDLIHGRHGEYGWDNNPWVWVYSFKLKQ